MGGLWCDSGCYCWVCENLFATNHEVYGLGL